MRIPDPVDEFIREVRNYPGDECRVMLADSVYDSEDSAEVALWRVDPNECAMYRKIGAEYVVFRYERQLTLAGF